MNTSLKNKFDSIIFDLDGTLWNSTRNVAIAWQTTAKHFEDIIKEEITAKTVESICGLTYDDIFEKLFHYLDKSQRLQFQQMCSVLELEVLSKTGGDLYPSLEETLKYLAQKYKLFVVSNCQSGYIEIFLNTSGLSRYFSGHQCYGTKKQPKWQNIRDIVNDHSLKAPVYIGDTIGDYNSSHKAGVPFIFAAYGFGQVESGQLADIGNLNELTRIF
jgi:phosphoglycolate phosphatase